MVYWDQMGCGINNHVIDDSFSVDTFVQMTEELMELFALCCSGGGSSLGKNL